MATETHRCCRRSRTGTPAGMPQLDFATFPNQIFWLVVDAGRDLSSCCRAWRCRASPPFWPSVRARSPTTSPPPKS